MSLSPEQLKQIEQHPDVAKARRISRRIKPSRVWQPMLRTGDWHPDGAAVFTNGLYCATLRNYSEGWPLGGGPWAMIGIWCDDGEPRHDWRDYQCIKNDLVGAGWEAIELYPSEARLLDPSNYYMLWCAPKIGVGKYDGRTIIAPEVAIAPQRGWAAGTPKQ